MVEEEKRAQCFSEARLWHTAGRPEACLDATLRAAEADSDFQAEERTMFGAAVTIALRHKKRSLHVLVVELQKLVCSLTDGQHCTGHHHNRCCCFCGLPILPSSFSMAVPPPAALTATVSLPTPSSPSLLDDKKGSFSHLHQQHLGGVGGGLGATSTSNSPPVQTHHATCDGRLLLGGSTVRCAGSSHVSDRAMWDRLALVQRYTMQSAADILATIQTVITTIDERLLPYSAIMEARVVYIKMKADCLRTASEIFSMIKDATSSTEAMTCAERAYEEAHQLATAHLQPNHITRLALALNFSVFVHRCKGDVERAIQITKDTIDLIHSEVVTRTMNQDANTLLFFLHTNLDHWRTTSATASSKKRLAG